MEEQMWTGIRPSRAPNLAAHDGRSPLARVTQQPLMLGLFLPLQSGAWTPTTAPRGTDWTFDYNANLMVRADELGFDLAFGLAQWRGVDGYGGATHYRKYALDPLLTTCAAAALTHNLILISTVHVLYGWHPLHLAKFGATADHISRGRWGLNLVTGYQSQERAMFGLTRLEHDTRYAMAAEFTEMMEALWREEANVDWHGVYWSMHQAYVSPKPLYGRPIMVNAASSDAGLRYAAKYADLIFITSPGGAHITAALETLPAHTKKIKALAAAAHREVRTVINPHVICRNTEREVQQIIDAIYAGEDRVAVDTFLGAREQGDQQSWAGHTRHERVLGGNVHVLGTPEQVVEQFMRLRAAGCDGIQVNFFDYEPDLEYFAAHVLPLMQQAGLRTSAGDASDP
jgi:FMNH2-dependent dimethyl sulfone monooxygenase